MSVSIFGLRHLRKPMVSSPLRRNEVDLEPFACEDGLKVRENRPIQPNLHAIK